MIYGAGGLGREILELVRQLNAHGKALECKAFVVDEPFATPDAVNGVPVHRKFQVLAQSKAVQFVIAIGDPAARARIAKTVEAAIGPRFATVVHPSAVIGANVVIGSGSMIMGLTSITSECQLGRHVLINPGCTVAHDSTINDFGTLSPGVNVAGRVCIREGCLLGVGANVVPDVTVGAWSIVGAGACVIRDIAPQSVAAGVPAQTIGTREDQGCIP